MVKLEFDPNQFRLTFECVECGATSDDPDRVKHLPNCPLAQEQEKSRKIHAISDALIRACKDLGVNLHSCERWPGSMSIATRMYQELNKE